MGKDGWLTPGPRSISKTGARAEVGAIKPPHPWENLPRDLGGLCTQLEDRHWNCCNWKIRAALVRNRVSGGRGAIWPQGWGCGRRQYRARPPRGAQTSPHPQRCSPLRGRLPCGPSVQPRPWPRVFSFILKHTHSTKYSQDPLRPLNLPQITLTGKRSFVSLNQLDFQGVRKALRASWHPPSSQKVQWAGGIAWCPSSEAQSKNKWSLVPSLPTRCGNDSKFKNKHTGLSS